MGCARSKPQAVDGDPAVANAVPSDEGLAANGKASQQPAPHSQTAAAEAGHIADLTEPAQQRASSGSLAALGRNSSETAASPSDLSTPAGSTHSTPPSGSIRGGRPPLHATMPLPGSYSKMTTLEEPQAVDVQPQPVSDSAGSTNLRPLRRMFPSVTAADEAVPPAPSASTTPVSVPGSPAAPPPELAHVLALLSRLLSASAVLVDLKNPPVAYVRDDTGLRVGEASTVRRQPGYQEVQLVGRGSRQLGTLGAATGAGQPGASTMLLTQMANVVVREVEMMQLQQAAAPRAGSEAGAEEYRPPPTPAVVLVDTAIPSWQSLVAEDGIEEVTGLPAAEWHGAALWSILGPPFGVRTGAWNAVNEVAACAGDLIITGVSCRAHPNLGSLILRCTPATEVLLAGQGRPQEWLDMLQGPRGDRARQPYLITCARDSPLSSAGRSGAYDSSRWATMHQTYHSSSHGSGGPGGEVGREGVPVEGVQLGPLLGKGSYGRVYHGQWHGDEVAVKVCNQGIARSGERTVKPWAGVEAVASLGLQHRHVMRTLNHTTVVVPAPPPRPAARGQTRGSLDLGGTQRPPMVRAVSSELDTIISGMPTGTLPAVAALRERPLGSNLANHSPNRSPAGSMRVPSAGAAQDLQLGAAALRNLADLRNAGDSGSPGPGSSAAVGRAGSAIFSPFADALSGRAQTLSGMAAGSSPPEALGGSLATAPGISGRSHSLVTHSGPSIRSGGSMEMQAEVDTWIIQEFANRGSLQRALEDGMFSHEDADGNRTPDMLAVLTAGRQLAAAMAYMHERGIIHGDLSRANILLMDNEESASGFDVKVADFGMARQLDVASRIDTFSCGTITHTAPELMDEGHLSKAADVFAMGILLWELRAGSAAWSGLNQAQIISAVLIHGRRPEFPTDTPPAYRALAEQCLLTDPRARPTCSEIETRLEAMLRQWEAGQLQDGDSAAMAPIADGQRGAEA